MKSATSIALIALFASVPVASAGHGRRFILWEHPNFNYDHDDKGGVWVEKIWDEKCWNLGEHGRMASSISSGDDGCAIFYNHIECKGESWIQSTSAATIPSFLDKNIWSFRNHDCPK
ncbi:hypothetical protein M011DRAFT_479379 [Sporormia fimetaria CBS 119925]|uniref:Uncharacterized protein n=1 Tax=Sporormia fimetaria CBS 119925 TaxID=1340428 RepID=A0A6A6V348_9PLEO|nr:hypothetical protein M011DRAFT_479379 [Sporormia fimetaria CBS 119925]